jgi:hypothetical protein
VSAQCLTCQWIDMRNQPRQKGKCWKDADGTGKLLDVLEVRSCRVYQLAPMVQVHARSKRRMVFNEAGVVKLYGKG